MTALAIDIEVDLGALSLRVALPASEGITVLIGPNGAGKSTLLKCVLGVVRPQRGRIALDDQLLLCTREGVDVPIEERRLGYVPQRYALFSHMSVLHNVAFGIRGAGRKRKHAMALELLEELGIAQLAERRTPSLSGGEAQRVALARALAIKPRALLLDEPMAALDAGARRKVRQLLAERLRAIGIPTIVVSHDVDDAEALGDRIAVLEGGQIVQLGTLDEVRRQPATAFVRELLAPRLRDSWRPPGGPDAGAPLPRDTSL